MIQTPAQSGPAQSVEVVTVVQDMSESSQRGVASLLWHRGAATRLIIVNDGAGPGCSAWLNSLDRDAVTVIEREISLGQTRALNAGLAAASAELVVVVQSGVVVSDGWLDGLVRCARTVPGVGLVAALSNAAAPEAPLVEERDTLRAQSAASIAAVVAAASERAYPPVHLVDGTCYLVTRALLSELRQLDEASFPLGPGAAHDLCLRAARAGFEIALADDVYVEAPEKGPEREALAGSIQAALIRKHGEAAQAAASQTPAEIDAVRGVRSRLRGSLALPTLPPMVAQPFRLAVLFLLSGKGDAGASHAVVQDAVAMRELGASCCIAVVGRSSAHLLKAHPELPGLRQLTTSVEQEELVELARAYDVVVAADYTSLRYVTHLSRVLPQVLPAYYVQDYEPLHFEPGSPSWREATAAHEGFPELVRFSRSRWVVDKVYEHHGLRVRQLPVGVDHDVYFPGDRGAASEVRIAALIRPQSTRRAAARNMRVLAQLKRLAPNVDVHLFGCSPEKQAFQELPRDFSFTSHGMLSRQEMGALLRTCDIFLDLSDYRAIGRLGLEAMACGCVAVLPKVGGAAEYAIDGINALLVDPADEAACVNRVLHLVTQVAERQRLREGALKAAKNHTARQSAWETLQLFKSSIEERALRRARLAASEPAMKSAARQDYQALARLFAQPSIQRTIGRLHLPQWPVAEQRLAGLRRKSRKLARDPDAFFADSKSSLVRGLGRLLRGAGRQQ